jgi:hypothetical protein
MIGVSVAFRGNFPVLAVISTVPCSSYYEWTPVRLAHMQSGSPPALAKLLRNFLL